MFLFLLWNYFIIFNSITKLNSLKYVQTCFVMLFLILVLNCVTPLKITIKTAVCISIIPSIVFWYFIIIFNSFLSLDPYRYEFLIFILFCYSYILLYIILDT